MPILKQRRELVLLAIGALVYWGASSWLEKPYCNIEHQDHETIRGKLPLYKYIFSKFYSQHRQLEGIQDYAMYIYVFSPYGIKYAYVTIDGARMNLYPPYGSASFTYELEGLKTQGRHFYQLDVMDGKGKKAHSQCYLTITANKTTP